MNRKLKWAIIALVGFFYSTSLVADQCTNVFPVGVGSSVAASQISFSCGSKIVNNPSDTLAVTTISNPNACDTPTCDQQNCTASGASLSPLNMGHFQSSAGTGGNITINASDTLGGSNNVTTDYKNITLQPNATLNFSSSPNNTVYRIQSLTLKNATTVNFQPGDYWIEHISFQGGQPITFNVQGKGTARIYFGNNVNVGETVAWNSDKAASQLFIYTYGNFSLSGVSSKVNAIIYAENNITLARTSIIGAVTGADVRLNNNSMVTYDGVAVSNTDFGVTCPKSFTQFALTASPVTQDCQTPSFNARQIAGDDFTMYLTAYNTNNCTIDTNYTGSKNIRFYSTYVNPSNGTINAKINGSIIANSETAAQTTQAINFENGVATLTVNYGDVGQLQVNVIEKVAAGASETPGAAGSSGKFVVIPAKFAINIPGNTVAQTTLPSSEAVSACLASTVFKKAGQNFTVHVQPQNAQGNVTPNYGNETIPEGIILNSALLLAPTSGRNGSNNNGTIANAKAFVKIQDNAGPFATGPYFSGSSFSFDEVGCINLSANIASGNYLTVGGNVSSTQVVGRFIPDHFDVAGNSPKFATACSSNAGSFTYLDQPFSFNTPPVLTVTAHSLSGSVTQNYTGAFWKLDAASLGANYQNAYYPVTVGDNIPNLNLAATIPMPVWVDGGNGTGTYTYSAGSGLSIQREANVLTPPLIAEIALALDSVSDGDGVLCTGQGCVSGGYVFGGTTLGNGISFSGSGAGPGKQFYHGRLVVINSNGSEDLPLTISMQAQIYTQNNGYVLNTLDFCSVLNGGVSSLDVSCSKGLATTTTLDSTPVFKGGNLYIHLSAPNTVGYADINPNLSATGANLPWLQSIWPGITGGSFTGDPFGRGTFGIYHGVDQVIYQKEVVH